MMAGETGCDADQAPVTAQDLYRHVMRDLVAPALRELGFSGSHARYFRARCDDYSGWLWTRKDRGSTRTAVYFWVRLGAGHDPTRTPYWHDDLRRLIPETASTWAIAWPSTSAAPQEPVAEAVLAGFRRYGWPAIQAAQQPWPDPERGPREQGHH